MQEIELNGQAYRIQKLDARKSFHVGRRLTPVLAGMAKASVEMGKVSDEEKTGVMLECIADDISVLPDAQLDYVIDECLSVVQRKQGDRWASVMTRGQFMFADMDESVMIQLVVAVAMESLGGFFGLLNGGSGSPES
jgi:hypothetical protein